MSNVTAYPEFLKTGFHVFRWRGSGSWIAVGPRFAGEGVDLQWLASKPETAASMLLASRERRDLRGRVTFADFEVHDGIE